MSIIRDLTVLLAEYGPFTICACIFLSIWWLFSKKRYESLSPADRKYLLITAQALIVVVIVFWGIAKFAIPREYVVEGFFEKIGAHDKILSGQLFLKRKYHGSEDFFDYDWKIVTRKKMAPGEKIKFCHDRSRAPDEELVCGYELEFDSSFYKKRVNIEYDRNMDMMFLSSDSHRTPLIKTAALNSIHEVDPNGKTVPSIMGYLFAETQRPALEPPRLLTAAEKTQIRSHLSSPDFMIRKRARDKLSCHGCRNPEFINELLNTESFWMRLGALEAIRGMESDRLIILQPHLAIPLLRQLAQSPNPTLQRSAVNVLRLLDTLELETSE